MPGVLAAVVLFLMTQAIFWTVRGLDKDSKTFDYTIEEDQPIFTGADRPNSLRVTYDGENIYSPRITRIKFQNTGKQVIKSTDIIDPFEVRRPNAKIFDVRIIDESERDLASFDGDAEKLIITPKTLNPGDWFTFRIMYDGGGGKEITVAGRIEGQTRRSESDLPGSNPPDDESSRAVGHLTAALTGALLIIVSFDALIQPAVPISTFAACSFIAMGSYTVTASLADYVRYRRDRRKVLTGHDS
ncbi:hypothetical protein [Mycobacteroides chelonae]|uniref:hypothetical protein n=1 Tax=Mycobacteroides chelonae TaxID=1774 RepID=UPI000AE34110|nr:hypothetical protein [Mycobacteroides chelonae]MBF9315238.1 hypothetical protein [Mycobacteroides chelonae]